MIFVREISPAGARLLVRLDAATIERADARLGSFSVFLGDPSTVSSSLKEFAAKNGIRNHVLSVMDTPPESYDIAADAAVTVILYSHHKVTANYAFRSGELNERAVDTIMARVNSMLPPK
jgi:hypothetical protein